MNNDIRGFYIQCMVSHYGKEVRKMNKGSKL